MLRIRPFRFVPGLLAGFLLTAMHAHAQAPYIPPELSDWREWVLHDHQQMNCPLFVAGRECVWPGRLTLSVSPDGARFSQPVDVFADAWFWLPGSQDTWPQSVTVDGKAAPVSERGGRPTLRLEAGAHRIAGRFEWNRSPETLALSSSTALVSLEIDGQSVPRPRWSDDLLWIAPDAQSQTEKAENQLTVTVYRTISDGAPAYMDMTMQIDISGDSREEVIGQLLPEGFAPADMTAPLPARLSDDGQLTIQARPGSWRFTFRARAPGPLQALTFSPEGEFWPREEVWSFAANTSLRIVEASSASPVDPVQAGVPAPARSLPSFRMQPGDQLTLVERQRGAADRDSDRLTMHRQLWLDFNRTGYTARDRISGVMVRDWRLDLAPPFALQSASMADAPPGSENLLVTRNPDDETLRGVEIRRPRIDVTALARLAERAGSLPVSGWQKRLDGVTTDLYLPPGHRLLYAAGADSDAHSWLNQWNLLHFFLVLVIAVALWRMYAPWLGVIALLALSLSVHEYGAPVWSWLNLVVAFALTKYLPTGSALRSARVYKFLSIISIVLIALPFAANQLRLAIYPQIELAAARPPPAITAQLPRAAKMADELEEVIVTGSRVERYAESPAAADLESSLSGVSAGNVLNRYDKNARVQTGPGVPNWTWQRYRLAWSGPVVNSQTTRLWIAPPWLMSVWRVAMVALIFGGLAALIRRDPARLSFRGTGTGAIVMLFACGGLLQIAEAPSAYANSPDPALLEELKRRLTTAPDCAPVCVSIPRASVRFDDQSLSIDLIVHAQADAAVAVPGTSGGWRPQSVVMNGRPVESVRRAAGTYQLRLDPGVHRVALTGALPNTNAISVAFPQVPYHVEVNGQGWEVTGFSDNRLAGGALTLIRQRTDTERSTLDAIDVEQFPAFVTVTRVLSFDLDWEILTTVTRRTPRTSAINLSIPLLAGESVTSENVEVDDAHAIVNLATGQSQFAWRSTMNRTPALTLHAEQAQPWQEIWTIVTGASWRLEHSGVPEMNVDQSQAPTWRLNFTPWPGETLVLAISRPTAVEGPTLAVDAATLIQETGQRSTTSRLEMRYRATRGTQHAVTLPAGSELIDVRHDGRDLNLALENGQLRLPVTPGAHTYTMQWRSDNGSRFYLAAERPELGLPVSNLRTTVNLPASRWAVWTRGPRLGPAVLYWSELAVFVLVALVLARIAKTPLRFRHWLLLGLGFSTFFWPAFVIVAAAFLALSWRARNTLEKPLAFNAAQLALAGLAIAAGLALVTTIPLGLLGTPDMHIRGNNSYAGAFNWFIDKSDGAFPAAGIVSLPLWVYKGLILIWALWLAFAILRWLPWMWRAFSKDSYWKRRRPLLETTPMKSAEESDE